MSDLAKLQDRAMEIRRRYEEVEKKREGQSWDTLKLAHGFRKDVSDLIEVMETSADRKKLNHELADCLWSILVIARRLEIDIERAFWTTMLELDKRLDEEIK